MIAYPLIGFTILALALVLAVRWLTDDFNEDDHL